MTMLCKPSAQILESTAYNDYGIKNCSINLTIAAPRTNKMWENCPQQPNFLEQIWLYNVTEFMCLSWEGNWGKYYWIAEQVLESQEQ